MKGAKVEVYFAMYLTAIISFFTVNELVEQWKKKAIEREVILIDVIKSLVELGDLVRYTDVTATNSEIRGAIALNHTYSLTRSLPVTLIAKPTAGGDSIVVSSDLVLQPGQKDWTFASSRLKPEVEYTIVLRSAVPASFSITKEGKDMIKERLLRAKTTKLTGAGINVDSLVDFIATNIQSSSTPLNIQFAQPITLQKGAEAEPAKPITYENPFIDRVHVIPAGMNQATLTFTYGNTTAQSMRGATFSVGRVRAVIASIDANTVTLRLQGSLDEGTHQVSVGGIPNMQTTNARVQAVNPVIYCESVYYDGDDIRATTNIRGEARLRWRIDKAGQTVRSGEVRDGAVVLPKADRGKYTVVIADENGATLASRSCEVRTPQAPEIARIDVDSSRTVSALVYVYGQRNGIKNVSGYAGVAQWSKKFDLVRTVESRKEFRLTCSVADSDCDKKIIILLGVEDENGTRAEKKDRKTVTCR